MSGCSITTAEAFEPAVRELISAGEVSRRILELGAELSAGENCGPVHLIVVLKGGLFFAAELARAVNRPLTFDFIQVASYCGARSGSLRLLQDLSEPICGRDVLIVEDIVDTGQTLAWLIEHLMPHNPHRLRSCTLLSRRFGPDRTCRPDFTGFEIGAEFVVGCGLDYNERFRELGFVGTLDLNPLPELAARRVE